MQTSSHAHFDDSCPCCRSRHTQPRRRAQRWGGVLGSVAGAVVGLAAAGVSASLRGPTVLRWPYALTSAVLGALVSAASGCRSGALLGRLLDETVIAQWVCLDCGFTFGGPMTPPEEPDPPSPAWRE